MTRLQKTCGMYLMNLHLASKSVWTQQEVVFATKHYLTKPEICVECLCVGVSAFGVTAGTPLCNKSLCLWMLGYSGIGRATSLALARCGAKVVAVTRTQADLNSLMQEVYSPPHIHTHTHSQKNHHRHPSGGPPSPTFVPILCASI